MPKEELSSSTILRLKTVSVMPCLMYLSIVIISSMTALTKKTKIRGQEYFLKLVDTAGQDEYSIFPAQYTIDTDGFILVYSINNQNSFQVVRVLFDKLVDLIGKVQ